MIGSLFKTLNHFFVDNLNDFRKWRYSIKEYHYFKNLTNSIEQKNKY